MKKLLTPLAVLLACLLLALPAFAETEAPATEAAVEDTATVPAAAPTTQAARPQGGGAFELTIDPNKRETDISFITDGLMGAAAPGAQDSAKQQLNKKIWVGVLCVLLVIAVIVLIVSLRRVPDKDNKELDDKEWGIDTADKDEDALDENRIIRPLEKPETPPEEPAPDEPEEVDDRPEDL